MKLKKIVAATVAFVLTVTACSLSVVSPVKADTPRETLAEFHPVYAGTLGDEDFDTALGDKRTGYLFTSGVKSSSALLFGSVNGADPSGDATTTEIFRKIQWSKPEYASEGNELDTNVVPVLSAKDEEGKRWGEKSYFLIQVSTSDYENLSFSAQLSATKKGPKDYKLQYSTTGKALSDFQDVDGATFSITDNKSMVTAFNATALPSACADVDTLYLLIVTTSQTSVGGSELSVNPGGGEIAIDNIRLSGTEKTSGTPSPAASKTPTPVTVAPATVAPVVTPSVAPTVKPKAVKKLKLNKKKVTLKKGKSIKLKVTKIPSSAVTKLKWTSSKKKVARVNSKGKVKALKKGKTTITVKASNGKKATCKVTVKK